MRTPEYSTQFRRDLKRMRKRGKDLARLKTMVELLLAGEPLPQRYKDHALKNDWAGYRDAHIEPDWLLIYFVNDDVLRLERTGTHSDLLD